MKEALHANDAWLELMGRLLTYGEPVAPRGQPTLEILHTNHLQVDLSRPVVTAPERKLNYRFMCAEALWILAGSNELAPLTRHVKRMAEFSDDGLTLAGAYGPPVVDQLPWVVQTLIKDRETRQAVLTTWRQRPGPSKDTPCTVAMAFSIRDDRLHQHVYMRSSDAWLGIPYDVFSFAMVGVKVACGYNRCLLAVNPIQRGLELPPARVKLGALTITATSSHLYERNLDEARAVLSAPVAPSVVPVPEDLVLEGRWLDVVQSLQAVESGFIPPTPWQLDRREGDDYAI